MSIVMSVRVAEGLVLAADSAATLNLVGPGGQQLGVAKVFNNATKVMQLKDYFIGVATWGTGNLGARTISSLVEEFANDRPALMDCRGSESTLSVEKEARELMDFLMRFYAKTFPNWQNQPQSERPSFGVIVGGFAGSDFFPKEYVFTIPNSQFQELRPTRPDGSQDFGANWFGTTDALVRFHHGRDERLMDVLRNNGIPQDVIGKIMEAISKDLQYQVPFDGMPLQDAVDYALFMAGLAIGRFRFSIGPEICGGPVDVVTITSQNGFEWMQRKQVKVR